MWLSRHKDWFSVKDQVQLQWVWFISLNQPIHHLGFYSPQKNEA